MNTARDQLVRLVGRGWDQVKGSLYRNAIFIMLTSVISSGLGFFFWLIVSIRYQQADIGAAITLFSTLGFVGVLGNLGIGVGLIRYLPETEDKPALVNAGLTLSGVVTFALSLVFLAVLPVLIPSLAFVLQDPPYILTIVLCTVTIGLAPILDSTSIAMRRAEMQTVRLTIFALLKIPGAAFTSFYAEASHKNVDRRRGERQAILLSVSLLLPAMAVLWIFSDPMLRLFGGGNPAYADNAVTPLRIMMFASIPVFLNGILGTRVRVRKRTLPLIISATIVTSITLGLGRFLLQNPDLGIDGLAYAYVIGQVAATPYLYLEARQAYEAVPSEPFLGQPLERSWPRRSRRPMPSPFGPPRGRISPRTSPPVPPPAPASPRPQRSHAPP